MDKARFTHIGPHGNMAEFTRISPPVVGTIHTRGVRLRMAAEGRTRSKYVRIALGQDVVDKMRIKAGDKLVVGFSAGHRAVAVFADTGGEFCALRPHKQSHNLYVRINHKCLPSGEFGAQILAAAERKARPAFEVRNGVLTIDLASAGDEA